MTIHLGQRKVAALKSTPYQHVTRHLERSKSLFKWCDVLQITIWLIGCNPRFYFVQILKPERADMFSGSSYLQKFIILLSRLFFYAAKCCGLFMFLNLMRESRHIECMHMSTCRVNLEKALLFKYYFIKLFLECVLCLKVWKESIIYNSW